MVPFTTVCKHFLIFSGSSLLRSIKVRRRCRLGLVKLDSLSALGLSPWAGLSFEFYVFVLISSDHFFFPGRVFSVALILSICKEGACFYKVPVPLDLHHLYGLAFCHCGSCLAVVCYVLTGVCYKAGITSGFAFQTFFFTVAINLHC